MFSCQLFKNIQNRFFAEKLQVTASEASLYSAEKLFL